MVRLIGKPDSSQLKGPPRIARRPFLFQPRRERKNRLPVTPRQTVEAGPDDSVLAQEAACFQTVRRLDAEDRAYGLGV